MIEKLTDVTNSTTEAVKETEIDSIRGTLIKIVVNLFVIIDTLFSVI